MATGVSKSQRQRPTEIESVPARANGSAIVRLHYEGKQEEATILSTAPATVCRIWPTELPGKESDRLYFAENLGALAALRNDPAVSGRVRLVYVDPPYATGGVFQSRKQQDAYDDLLMGAHYLEFLRARLIMLRELLAPDGSIYVHLDENMANEAKMRTGEAFGSRNYRSFISRKKCNPKIHHHTEHTLIASGWR